MAHKESNNKPISSSIFAPKLDWLISVPGLGPRSLYCMEANDPINFISLFNPNIVYPINTNESLIDNHRLLSATFCVANQVDDKP